MGARGGSAHVKGTLISLCTSQSKCSVYVKEIIHLNLSSQGFTRLVAEQIVLVAIVTNRELDRRLLKRSPACSRKREGKAILKATEAGCLMLGASRIPYDAQYAVARSRRSTEWR